MEHRYDNSGNWQNLLNTSLSDFTETGDTASINTTISYKYYWDWWYPYYIEYVPVKVEKNKIEEAFKVISILIKKKIIKVEKLTVGKFIDLVNELAKEL